MEPRAVRAREECSSTAPLSDSSGALVEWICVGSCNSSASGCNSCAASGCNSCSDRSGSPCGTSAGARTRRTPVSSNADCSGRAECGGQARTKGGLRGLCARSGPGRRASTVQRFRDESGSRGCTSSRNATDEITAYSVVEEEDRNATPRRCGKGEGEERPSVSPRAGEQHSPISEKEAGGSPADTRAGADAICNRWEGRAIASAEVPAPLCSATRLPSPVANGDESGHHRGRTRAPGAHPELAEPRHS